ncbi:MAG TPA: pseudouridine synthase [Clostridiales bacterium]|nr:pseudouridine synthase [Clostridiales bacterium]
MKNASKRRMIDLSHRQENSLEDNRSINKYISDSGYCSRREADRLLEAGKVTINSRVANKAERVPYGASVTVNGVLLDGAGQKVYLALFKPRGIVCTTDRREPLNIVDYINYPGRIFPIGRLDKDSEGLILLTSDGDIVNRILRATGQHEKEYLVTVDKPITPRFLQRMAEGVPILGQITLPCVIHQTGQHSFRLILVQGLNRQIRRMCEYLGYQVTHLRRVRIMNIRLGKMQPGHWRELSKKELDTLMATLAKSTDDISTNLDDEE